MIHLIIRIICFPHVFGNKTATLILFMFSDSKIPHQMILWCVVQLMMHNINYICHMFLKNIDQPNLRTVRFSSELAQPKNIRLLCVELNQGFRLSGELSEDMWTVGPREEDGDGIHWCQKGFSKGCETTNLILFKCVLHMHVYIK